jgi:hypothetical protein
VLCRKIKEKHKSQRSHLLWNFSAAKDSIPSHRVVPISLEELTISNPIWFGQPKATSTVKEQELREDVIEQDHSSSSDYPYKLQFTRPLLQTVQDASKTTTERLVGTEMPWWPLSEPERELEASCTRVYSQAFIHSSPRSPSFYDDIPNSLAEKLFSELAAARRTAPKSRWAARNRDSVILSGTTLIRLLSSYDVQFTHRVKSWINTHWLIDRTKQSIGKEHQLSLPYASKGSQNITSTVSKGKGKQQNLERDDKSSTEMTRYNEVSTKDAGRSQPADAGRSPPSKDSANENIEDLGKGSPTGVPAKVDTKQCDPDDPGPVVFVCADKFTNDSKARSVFIGANDTDRTTMKNLRTAYNSLGSRYFWKRRSGVKFYCVC